MKKIVDPETAASEGSNKAGSNHPFMIYLLGEGNKVVRKESAKGFICAKKVAPKLIDGARIVLAAVFCSKDVVPAKFRKGFKPINIEGDRRECFIIGKPA